MFELQIDNLSKPLQPWFLRRFTSSNNYFRRYIVSKQKSFFSFFLTYCQSPPNLVVPSQLVVICRHCDFFLRHVSRNSANFVWICKILYIHISLKTSFAPSSREQWKMRWERVCVIRRHKYMQNISLILKDILVIFTDISQKGNL